MTRGLGKVQAHLKLIYMVPGETKGIHYHRGAFDLPRLS